jgi:hypothetical protein
MNFKQFLEFSDINAMDTSHIDLQYVNGTYFYQFEVNGVQYRLEMDPRGIIVLDTMMRGYTISFTGDHRYGPTNKQGGSASEVYTHIMLGIKKFLEEVQHNPTRPAEVLNFYGFEGKQDLVYDRLVRRFLTGYTRVDKENLVRNDLLDALKQQDGPSVSQKVQQGQEDYNNHLKQTRQELRNK